MKTTIVCGLLGSGKTTFIRHYLSGAREKTVVLVNDFGAAGIDGEIFSAGGIEAVELPGGCVCCTLKFDLITTIKKIVRDFSPVHLVIEPSGVASPIGVIEAVESVGLDPATVIGVVDTAEFLELHDSGMYGSFFRDQIACSDIILVNKIDLADEDQVINTIRTIETINPKALLFPTKNAVLHDDAFLPLPVGERAGRRGEAATSKFLVNGNSHVPFETLSVKLSGGTRLDQFSRFFDILVSGKFGAVARAKALLATEDGPYRFDGVYGKVDRVRFEREIGDSRLVVIGTALDELMIRKSLEEWSCRLPHR